MPKEKEKMIYELIKKNDISFIKIWFTDILGYLKSFVITKDELPRAFEEGMGFDGSSIEGFCRIDESDMLAMPDPDTFMILPWRPSEKATGAMFADILMPDGTPFIGDPRYALKRNLKKMKDMGFSNFFVGPELEFFYFKNSTSPEPLDFGGYFDIIPRDEAIDLRRDTIIALDKLNITVEYAHHEVAHSQHEIDLRYTDALKMADQVMTYRLAVKEIAQQHGVYATFMPKPIFGQNGSGMHIHMSLFKDNGKTNAFYDDTRRYNLSETAESFIAGVLNHAPCLTAVTNQWVNSYKRLVPGYEAPVYISWAQRNRSDLIRVPMAKPGKSNATRIEYRSPDPAANPYLAFSLLLGAGLEGIKNNLKAPTPVEENVYDMSSEEQKERGIKQLPGSLIEALNLFENEGKELNSQILGDHIFTHFIENKHLEWEKYRTFVTSYEVENYLPVL